MYAIYFEFRKDSGDAYQALYIPPSPIGLHVTNPIYAFKNLTRLKPRRVWELHANPGYRYLDVSAENTAALMREEIRQLDGLHVYITSLLIDPDWKTVGSFPVEVTQSDLLALKESETRLPSDLNARIRLARSVNGFPALPEVAS